LQASKEHETMPLPLRLLRELGASRNSALSSDAACLRVLIAYDLQIAELGVTESDWQALGGAAAAALQLPVARAAFDKLNDEPALALLARVETQWRDGGSHDLCTAEVLAYQVSLHTSFDSDNTNAHRNSCALHAKLALALIARVEA